MTPKLIFLAPRWRTNGDIVVCSKVNFHVRFWFGLVLSLLSCQPFWTINHWHERCQQWILQHVLKSWHKSQTTSFLGCLELYPRKKYPLKSRIFSVKNQNCLNWGFSVKKFGIITLLESFSHEMAINAFVDIC